MNHHKQPVDVTVQPQLINTTAPCLRDWKRHFVGPSGGSEKSRALRDFGEGIRSTVVVVVPESRLSDYLTQLDRKKSPAVAPLDLKPMPVGDQVPDKPSSGNHPVENA